MKYNLKIGDKSFEVEIEDVNKRPIVARVNGQEFLVSPENNPLALKTDVSQVSTTQPVIQGHPDDMHNGTLVAPLPGTIIEVFVKPGDVVDAGQVILIIEAMKMKNSIRSTKDGIVKQVLVSAGQTVTHKQGLVEFKE